MRQLQIDNKYGRMSWSGKGAVTPAPVVCEDYGDDDDGGGFS